MTNIDKERVVIFRRLLNGDLLDIEDNDLLIILNKSIIPNSLSATAFKYTYFFNLILNKKKTIESVKKINYLESVLSKIELSLVKFGISRGFDSFNSEYQYSRFISTSIDLSKDNLSKKKISSIYFEKIFSFIYTIIYRGEKNERFPRI